MRRTRSHFLAVAFAAACAALFAVSVSITARAQDAAAPTSTPGAAAQPEQAAPRGSAEVIRKARAELDSQGKAIGSLKSTVDSGLVPTFRMRDTIANLEKRRVELRALVDRLSPALTDANTRLQQLGPPPKEGAQEPPELARQRKALTDEVSALDALMKQAELLFVQAGQALATLNAQRRAQFTRQLLERSDDLGTASFWNQAFSSLGPAVYGAISSGNQRIAHAISTHPLTLGGSLLLALLAGMGCRFLTKLMIRRRPVADQPTSPRTRAQRGALVLLRAARATMPLLVAIGILMLTISESSLAAGETGHVLFMSLIYVVVAAFLIAIVSFALSPEHTPDRLIALDDIAAMRVRMAVVAFVAVWLGDQVLTLLDKVLATPLALVILRLLVVSLLYSGLLLVTAWITVQIGTNAAASPPTRQTGQWIAAALAIAATLITAAAAMGYVSLARFAGGQIVATGGLLLLLSLIHLTAEHISSRQTQAQDSEPDSEGAKVGTSFMSATLGVALGIGLDLLMLLIGLPLLLLQWGYDWSEVYGWAQSAFFGFTVGSVRISLQSIFVAIVIVAAGIFATRMIRNMLLRRMEHVFVDSGGARDSIAAILTYAGFVVSLLVAMSYIGISVSSLAIVAGALSVGIGFGLQSIANNFVSGLILLAERPIKVGDWIVLGDQQGRVQKISVRSTEIQTFDRSTLIVPNSDLITGRVVNWTYADTMGRVTVRIGVSYDADPRQVIEILRKIGRDSPNTLAYPEPVVVFEAFGDSALEFSLRVYLRDIGTSLDIQTELRLAMFEALKAQGIEIPYPQRDLHIRSDDRAAPEESRSPILKPKAVVG